MELENLGEGQSERGDSPHVKPHEPAALMGGRRLEHLKEMLLDLSLRNRLLNFRETKNTLRLSAGELSAMEDQLSMGRPFRILPGGLQRGRTHARRSSQRSWPKSLVPKMRQNRGGGSSWLISRPRS